MRILRLVVLTLLIGALSGCRQATPPVTPETVEALPTAASQEAPTQTVVQPTPTPAPTAIPTAPIHNTPSPGKGNVIGAISRVPRGLPAEPMAGRALYLARLLENAQGQLAGIAGLDEKEAPLAVADDEGRFIFQDVEPGFYALIIKHPITLILAHDLLTDRDVVTEVRPDITSDLGELQVEVND
ncbi:MAG: hypothetical protein V1772_01375 [Chloroflexota bacterium]